MLFMYDGQPLHLATNLYTESGLSSVPKYIFTRYPRLRPRGINPNPPYKVKLVKTSSPREGFHLMTRRTQDSNLQWLSPSPAFKAGSLPIRIIRHLNGRQKGTRTLTHYAFDSKSKLSTSSSICPYE